MYKTFENHSIDKKDLAEIIHYVIKILNKFKSIINSEIDIKSIVDAPSGNNFMIAKELLEEIKATTLINKDDQIKNHINKLYEYLEKVLDSGPEYDKKNGIKLLEKLRKQ